MHRINLIRSGRDRPKTFPTRRPFGCPKPSSRLYDGTQRSTPELRLGPHRRGHLATPDWQHTTPTLRPGLLSESPVTGSESGRVLRRATARLRLGPPRGPGRDLRVPSLCAHAGGYCSSPAAPPVSPRRILASRPGCLTPRAFNDARRALEERPFEREALPTRRQDVERPLRQSAAASASWSSSEGSGAAKDMKAC